MTKRKTVLIFGVLILTGLAWFIIHQVQVNSQRKNFTETKNWLNSLVKRSDQGSANIAYEEYCRHKSEKYQHGARSCFLEHYSYYTVDKSKTEKLVQDISSIVDAETETKTRYPQSAQMESLAATTFTRNQLDCGVTYEYVREESNIGRSSSLPSTMNGLLVSYACSGPAMADYFPSRS